MHISLTKEQYEELMRACHIAGEVLGLIGDAVPEEYKALSNRMEELEKHVLQHAREFGYADLIEHVEGEPYLKEEVYERMAEPLNEYDDYIFWDELTTRLGQRDFDRETPSEQFREMDRYDVMVNLSEYYDRYTQEFERHGVERLEIKV